VRRLLSDPRVPRRRKPLIVLLVAFLAMAFDLVPDHPGRRPARRRDPRGDPPAHDPALRRPEAARSLAGPGAVASVNGAAGRTAARSTYRGSSLSLGTMSDLCELSDADRVSHGPLDPVSRQNGSWESALLEVAIHGAVRVDVLHVREKGVLGRVGEFLA
jgi:hypothetical protein